MIHNQSSVVFELSNGDLDLPTVASNSLISCKIRHLDNLIVTSPRETSKNYYAIREVHYKLFR